MVKGPDGKPAFVNPYSSVPLPRIPEDSPDFRRQPGGHDRLGRDRYSGRIEVELTARSPLLLRGIQPERETERGSAKGSGEESEKETRKGRFPRRIFPGSDGEPAFGGRSVPFLPGSSLAGAVRSLHEVLAGGCLRVVDLEYVPTYRDVVEPRGEDWTLALVESEKDGRPESLLLCEEVVWVPATLLAQVLGSPESVETGARVDVIKKDWFRFFRRFHADKTHQVRPGGDWVVLVTDVGARQEKMSKDADGELRPATYWCAVGKLPEADADADPHGLPMTDAAWKDYLAAVDDTDDVRRAREDDRKNPPRAGDAGSALFPSRPKRAEVQYHDELVGVRHEARPVLRTGQVVWARDGWAAPDEAEEQAEEQAAGQRRRKAQRRVTAIALSAVWRHPGRYPVSERIPPALQPCHGDDLQLCPTCRVFGSADTRGSADSRGSADTRGEDTAEARQRSYRGHVRFGEARPQADYPTQEVHLAPLGSPKLSAGQPYLFNGPFEGKTDDKVERRGGTEGESTSGSSGSEPRRPLREWGSAADRPGKVRPLRGRKKYWLTAQSARRPFFRAEGEWEGELASEAEQVDAGARFTFPVYVDGLDATQLGGLLAALDPDLLFHEQRVGDEEFGYAVGGGKPLGFGTCTARITAFEVTGAHARYLGDDQGQLTMPEAVNAFRQATPDEIRDTWKAARAVLTLDHVAPEAVWYPPGKPLPTSGPLHVDDLAPGFKGFWTHTQGLGVGESGRPLRSLPRAASPDQTLPVLDDEGNPAK